jgi:P-type E1-E2 ATPase
MVGVGSFINKLKEETVGVIDRLRGEVCVNVKMITGDNIYTAVQTGYKSGMIAENEKVVVCESQNVMDR